MQHLITSPLIPSLEILLQLRPPVLKETSRFHSRPTATPGFLERGGTTPSNGNVRILCITHLFGYCNVECHLDCEYRRMVAKE